MTRIVLALALVLALAGFGGCGQLARPDIPQTVTVVVEKDRPLPPWATEPLPKPQPVDGTVGARTASHDQRGIVIDLANCHRRLLDRLGRGEKVDPKECQQP